MKILEYSYKWYNNRKRTWRERSGTVPYAGSGKYWKYTSSRGYHKRPISDLMSVGVQTVKDKEKNIREATEEEVEKYIERGKKNMEKHCPPWYNDSI